MTWKLPTQFYQYAESGAEQAHVTWNEAQYQNLRNVDGAYLSVTGPLFHIARSPKHDLTNKTYYLRLTGFGFSGISEPINGVEVRLSTNRYGRVTDDTVQLCVNGELLGENQATLPVNPKKIYGGPTATWGVNVLTNTVIEDPTFGVVLRFKAHPSWPHASPMLIEAVEIRIH